MKRYGWGMLLFGLLWAGGFSASAYDLETVGRTYLTEEGAYTTIATGETMTFEGDTISYEWGQIAGMNAHVKQMGYGYVAKLEIPGSKETYGGLFRENLTHRDWQTLISLDRRLLTEGSDFQKTLLRFLRGAWVKIHGGLLQDAPKFVLHAIEPFHKVGEKGVYMYTAGATVKEKTGRGMDDYARVYAFFHGDHLDVLVLFMPDEGRKAVTYMMDDLAVGAAKEARKEDEKPLGVMMVDGQAGPMLTGT